MRRGIDNRPIGASRKPSLLFRCISTAFHSGKRMNKKKALESSRERRGIYRTFSSMASVPREEKLKATPAISLTSKRFLHHFTKPEFPFYLLLSFTSLTRGKLE